MYKTLNQCLVVKVTDMRGSSEFFDLPSQQLAEHLCIGARIRVPLNEAVECEVVAGNDSIKTGETIYTVSSSLNWIPNDDNNYWVEDSMVLMVGKEPYKDNILCREISPYENVKKSGIELPEHIAGQTNCTKAFVYIGDSELKQGEVVFYNWQKKKKCEIEGEKLFFINKEDIKGVIEPISQK